MYRVQINISETESASEYYAAIIVIEFCRYKTTIAEHDEKSM